MLAGKNIVVTGANRGIGAAIVAECAHNHANVWACMRSINEDVIEEYETMARTYNVFIEPVILDLYSEDSIINAAKKIISEKKPIYGVVNNAGITDDNRLFSMTSMEEIRNTFEVNFFGPFLFTQRLIIKMMREKTGSIVNISSIAAIDGEPAQFGYVTSKAAVIGATKKLASELGVFGIRVNSIAPGITDTEMIQKMSYENKEKMLGRTIMNRFATCDEIARAVIFLLSNQSEYITGQVIRVDGGGL